MQHDPHLKPKPKDETLEDIQEKHFPTLSPETLAEIMPNRPRRGDVPTLKDSGNRRRFSSGAMRDRAVGKGRFDLLTPQMMFRLARHYEAGAIKYTDRNWEKGMQFSNYVDSALRHIEKYKDGWMDEDHLAAAVWNLAALMHHEQEYPELDDLPRRRREGVDMFKWVVERPEDA